MPPYNARLGCCAATGVACRHDSSGRCCRRNLPVIFIASVIRLEIAIGRARRDAAFTVGVSRGA